MRRALIKPPSSARRGALRDACVAHLTRKVPKLYTADWLVHRSLAGDDALQCARNGSEPQDRHWRRTLLGRMPDLGHKYSFEEELCRGQSSACAFCSRVGRGRQPDSRPMRSHDRWHRICEESYLVSARASRPRPYIISDIIS